MRDFGQLEAEVMDRLWAADGPCTVREILTDLVATRPLAYTTVMTVMDKLYRKGWLDRESVGRAYAYTPRMSREHYTADLMSQALAASSDPRATLVAFLDQLSPADAASLRVALEKRAHRASKRSDR
ncbi:MAG: BlaI/MecI/CopY family transcriptional regulator [Streptomycetales bacterium]